MAEETPPPQPGERPKRKAAVALSYEKGADAAPRVVAAGRGHVAGRILEAAREHLVPVRDDPVLTAALLRVEVGREIPPELYRAVAEVLAFVYRLQNRAGGLG